MSLVSVAQATDLLDQGEVVALPTETVYGLAGKINDESALKKIFSTKARPFFDPLIVHVKNLEQAKDYAHWDKFSLKLAERFWPGPLTLVLPKKNNVSDFITHGGPTVALRQPHHPLFLQILNKLDSPLAAPSANKFGQTSPTSALHVEEEFNSLVSVVDGGECSAGIESTVVEYIQNENKLRILRPGVISPTEILSELKKWDKKIQVEVVRAENSPGNLKNHYQPQVPFFLLYGFHSSSIPPNLIDQMSQTAGNPIKLWTLDLSPEIAARNLYKNLREFSRNQQPIYLVVQKNWGNDLWESLLDRLNKAAHFIVTANAESWKIESK